MHTQRFPAITSLTDSSGGTATSVLPAITATPTQTVLRDSVASLAAKVEEILDYLRAAGRIKE